MQDLARCRRWYMILIASLILLSQTLVQARDLTAIRRDTSARKTIGPKSAEHDITCTPNPSEGKFQLSFRFAEGQRDAQVTFYNLIGARIFHLDVKDYPDQVFQEEFDLSRQEKGFYMIKVTQGDKTFTRRILIK